MHQVREWKRKEEQIGRISYLDEEQNDADGRAEADDAMEMEHRVQPMGAQIWKPTPWMSRNSRSRPMVYLSTAAAAAAMGLELQVQALADLGAGAAA